MPAPISKEVRAFAFGLIKGVGGSPYTPREIVRLINERFETKISPKTISNWKLDLPGYMKKYGIGDDYIKEVIDRGLFGAIKPERIPEDLEEKNEDVGGTPPREVDEVKELREEIMALPAFASLAEMVGYMERQGFIVATSDQDLRDILNQSGLTVLEKGALQYGPEIISIDPIEMDFEVVGKKIAGNPVIMWYYALARKLSALTGEEPPELDLFVTGCVVDAMVARRWNMAVLRT